VAFESDFKIAKASSLSVGFPKALLLCQTIVSLVTKFHFLVILLQKHQLSIRLESCYLFSFLDVVEKSLQLLLIEFQNQFQIFKKLLSSGRTGGQNQFVLF
jgi:hypothetical protein